MNYINEINNLKYQLNEEKKKNEKLYNENTNLKNIITNLNNEINKLKQYKHKNKLLQEEINKQNIEIQKYKSDNNTDFDEGISSSWSSSRNSFMPSSGSALRLAQNNDEIKMMTRKTKACFFILSFLN